MGSESKKEKKASMMIIEGAGEVNRGDYMGGMKKILEGIPICPDIALYHGMLANGYLHKGIYDKARMAYEKALELEPERIEYLVNLSVAYGKLNMLARAEATLYKIWKSNPEDFETLYNMGSNYQDLRKYGKAIDAYSKVIEKNPKRTRALIYRAECKMFMGDIEGAEADISQWLEIDPDDKDAIRIRHLLQIIEKTGPNISTLEKEMIKIQKELLHENESLEELYEDWLFKADVLREEKKDELALLAYERVLTLEPNDYKAIENQGYLLYKFNRDEIQAKSILISSKLDKILPEEYWDIRAAAILPFDIHAHNPARRRKDTYACVLPKETSSDIQQDLWISQQYAKLGDYTSAYLLLDFILWNEPDLGVALLFKARLLYADGEFSEALRVIEHLLWLKNDYEEALHLAWAIHKKLKNKDKVRNFADKIYAIDQLKITESSFLNDGLMGEVITSARVTKMSVSPRKGKNFIELNEIERHIEGVFLGGVDALNSRNYAMAIKNMELVNQLEPNFGDGQVVYAIAKMGLKEYDEAEKALNHILSIKSDFELALKMRSKLEDVKAGGKVPRFRRPKVHNYFRWDIPENTQRGVPSENKLGEKLREEYDPEDYFPFDVTRHWSSQIEERIDEVKQSFRITINRLLRKQPRRKLKKRYSQRELDSRYIGRIKLFVLFPFLYLVIPLLITSLVDGLYFISLPLIPFLILRKFANHGFSIKERDKGAFIASLLTFVITWITAANYESKVRVPVDEILTALFMAVLVIVLATYYSKKNKY